MTVNILLIFAAYLLGSVPSAVWIGRRFYGTDIREHGSRNAGATNTLRVLGRKAAMIVFAMDVLKGFAAVSLCWLSGYSHGSDYLFDLKVTLVAAAVLGHIFPIFAGFKGGKGVATLAGATLGVYPSAVAICLVVFMIVLLATRYVSLSSMAGGVSFPLIIYFVFGERSTSLIIYSIVVACLLIFTHRKNIKRLIKGTESRIYFCKKQKDAEGNKSEENDDAEIEEEERFF